MSEENIIAELYSKGIIRCKRIKITRNAQTIQTNTYILTFNRLQLPSVINMGYLRVRVEKYIPSPLRCTKCQKFGHHFSKCRNHTAICFRCSVSLPLPEVQDMPAKCNKCENHHPNPKCVNCGEDHPSFYKECPKYKKEQEIISLKYTLNISFPEAWKRIQSKLESALCGDANPRRLQRESCCG